MKLTNGEVWQAGNALARICSMEGLKNSTLVMRLALCKNWLHPFYKKVEGTRMDLAKTLKVVGLARFNPDGTAASLAEDQRDSLDQFEARWREVLEQEHADFPEDWKAPAPISVQLFKGAKEMPRPDDVAACLLLGIIVDGEPVADKKEGGVV